MKVEDKTLFLKPILGKSASKASQKPAFSSNTLRITNNTVQEGFKRNITLAAKKYTFSFFMDKGLEDLNDKEYFSVDIINSSNAIVYTYTTKVNATGYYNFDYSATTAGTYTWRFRRVSLNGRSSSGIAYFDDFKVSSTIQQSQQVCSSPKNYRFGFNTQEKDDEVYGAGNLNTAMFWEYDTRLGRRWNVDPKPRVGISDYSVMDGNPIWKNDVLGDEPTKKEAWAMSKIVYGKNDKATAKARKILQKGGWEVSKETFDIQKKSNESGFKSELFVRTDKEGTEYAYATTGTEKGDNRDWTKGNLPQFIGLSEQYNLSMENAKLIRQGAKGKEITFTGHSLGGGMAAANAYATGGKAITFNPAGVSGLTMATIAVNYGFKMVFAKIDAHILLTDPLNMFNAVTTRTDGTKHLYKPTDGASYTHGHDLDNLGKSLGIK
jgi:hypothetical protein